MSLDSEVVPGYLNVKQAAAYLGYGVSTFREYARRGNLPRYGPKGNRFRRADLDAFMADPFAFSSPVQVRRRLRTGFTPVAI